MLWFEFNIVEVSEEVKGSITIEELPFISVEMADCNVTLTNYKSTSSKGGIIKLNGFIPHETNKLYLTIVGQSMNTRKIQHSDMTKIVTISGSFVYRINS